MKLTVIGIGGCGCNTVGSLSKKGLTDVRLMMVDNEKEMVKRVSAVDRLIIESRDPAMEENLRALVSDSPEMLVVAGMGGRYSIEVVESLCRIHRQMHGNQGFVWVFVVMPFDFEGRTRRATENLAKVKEAATKVITFDNNTLRQHNDLPLNEAFSQVNQEVCNVIESIK